VNLRQLRHFVAVAEELHFGRAAARLQIAGPAVSQTIRGLEDELGLVLFDRTNRRVELTAAGHVLLGEARAVLERAAAAQAVMANLKTGKAGRVRIGAVPALPPLVIPALLARCASRLPDVDVVISALPSGSSAVGSLASGVDIALIRGEPADPEIESVVVTREPVGVALPANHPLARRRAIKARALNGVPMIGFPRTSDPTQFDRVFSVLRDAGLTDLELVHESHPGAVDTSLRLVAEGTGVSLKLYSEVQAFAGGDITWRSLADVTVDVVISATWYRKRLSATARRVLPLLAVVAENERAREDSNL
jgi:DNA-binding transcriptional LysR family regulator